MKVPKMSTNTTAKLLTRFELKPARGKQFERFSETNESTVNFNGTVNQNCPVPLKASKIAVRANVICM